MKTDNELLLQLRRPLKHQLCLERQRLLNGVFSPVCAYCGCGIIRVDPDMHEVFFTKGDVQGVEHLYPLIYSRCNCALLHPGGNQSPCHAGAADKDGQLRVVRYLIYWEGTAALHAYVDRIAEHMKNKTPCVEAHNLIELGGSDDLLSMWARD